MKLNFDEPAAIIAGAAARFVTVRDVASSAEVVDLEVDYSSLGTDCREAVREDPLGERLVFAKAARSDDRDGKSTTKPYFT